MVQFDELVITKDSKNLIIRAHVNTMKFYDALSIKALYIYTEDYIDDSGWANESNAIYVKKDFEEGTREIDITLNCNEIISDKFTAKDFSKNLFFIFIETEGDAFCAPCGMNSSWSVGVTFNKALLYDKAMGYIKTLGRDCETPDGFIDFILQFSGLDMAIESENYNLAIKLFKKLFNTTVRNTIKPCGCHG